jgi:hypothetical protein
MHVRPHITTSSLCAASHHHIVLTHAHKHLLSKFCLQFLADLPLEVVQVVIISFITYFFVGFQASVFYEFLAAMFVNSCMFQVGICRHTTLA